MGVYGWVRRMLRLTVRNLIGSPREEQRANVRDLVSSFLYT